MTVCGLSRRGKTTAEGFCTNEIIFMAHEPPEGGYALQPFDCAIVRRLKSNVNPFAGFAFTQPARAGIPNLRQFDIKRPGNHRPGKPPQGDIHVPQLERVIVSCIVARAPLAWCRSGHWLVYAGDLSATARSVSR
jgi:hypothetical protein